MFEALINRRRLLGGVAAGAMILAVTVPVTAEPTKITFLHTNDLYEIGPRDGLGGVAELATLLRAERASARHSITTFGGDLISPSLMSGITHGAQMIELMNAVGLDIAVAGNHEFDFGPEVAAQRFKEAQFTWLGTNVLAKDGRPALGMKDVVTKKIGELTIGFFGLLTPETDDTSSPGKGIQIADVAETAEKAVERLRAADADIVVALTHLGIDQDRELAASVSGIDLILGGHDHGPITFYEGGVLVHKSGHNAQYLGVVDLFVEWRTIDGKKKLNVRPAWRMISTGGVTPDPEIKVIVDKYNVRLEADLAVVVGTTMVALDSRRNSVRAMETNMGDLIAEAMRVAVKADIALVNGGGIRGDRVYAPGTQLTRRDVLNEFPFGNVTVLLDLLGSDLLAALENGVSKIEENAGRFPQVAGMTFVYNAAAPVGSRIVEAKIGGEPLDENRTYRLATSDFLANGGDDYESLKNGDVIIDASAGPLIVTTVMNYIAAEKVLSPKVDGRIIRK